MVARLTKSLSPPKPANDGLAAILHNILLILLAASLPIVLTIVLWQSWYALGGIFITDLVLVGCLLMVQHGQTTIPGITVPTLLLIATTVILWQGDGIHDLAVLSYAVTLILSGLLLGKYAPFLFAGLSIAAVGIVYAGEQAGAVAPYLAAYTGIDDLALIGALLGIGAIIMFMIISGLDESLKRARRNEDHLTTIVSQMEREAAERVQAEAIAQEIHRAMLSERTPDEITTRVLRSMRQMIPCQRASVTLFDFDRNEAYFLAADFDVPSPYEQDIITLQQYGQYIIDELRLGRPCFVNDVLTHPSATELDRLLAENGLSVWLYLPLLYQEQLTGALNLGRTAGNPFTPADAEIASRIADQLAIAIHQSRLYDALQKELAERIQAEERERLAFELAQQLTTVMGPDVLLDTTVNRLQQTLGYYHAQAYLLDANSGLLILRAASGEIGQQLRAISHQIPLSASPSLVAQAARDRAPMIVNDVRLSDSHLANPLLPDTLSEVAIPLLIGSHVLGVLDIQHDRPDGFGPRDQRMLQMVASWLAIAISNASRFQDIAILNQELEARVEERTAQLAAANRELEAFAYSVSHDLRAPLRSIHGFSQALLEDHADSLNSEGRDFLRRVHSASQRMGDLIEALLGLSRVTRREMRRETVDLSALARELGAGLHEANPDRQVEFIVHEGMTVTGDGSLLRIALQNLIGNAWKFTRGTPAARIEIGVMQSGDGPEYYIRDNGAGFDMAFANRLFGAFQRLHTDEQFEGTGIGLATVQRIIHRHGGHIRSEASPGKGATFYFTLPG